MIKVALCDQSIQTYYAIKRCLEQCALSYKSPISFCYYATVDELVFSYQGQYDILFLDTVVNQKSGIDAAKCIREIDARVFIVFVTAHDNFGAESYQIRATSYLLKPFSAETLRQTFHRMYVELLKEKDYIIGKSKNRIVKLPIEDILYVEYCNHKLIFHMFFEDSETMYGSYQQLFEQKSANCLYQIHRSYVINMIWIEHIENKAIYLQNVSQGFIVSRARWKDFLHTYQRFLNSKQ
ncbi:MAG: LytTR family DNA-binding domain-containing protein [Bacteroidales bacterium]|nr:LytTR family DNA-binding domain-containing protein [Lachnoclostridium sp.]MCM1384284.1 LytTR family DNA-binding domain-containing protein [Lachnoclostridium sp.]MCM1464784.1 LytTR family DNA-binding domain-containing protein [Bacteroidales bacterium]